MTEAREPIGLQPAPISATKPDQAHRELHSLDAEEPARRLDSSEPPAYQRRSGRSPAVS